MAHDGIKDMDALKDKLGQRPHHHYVCVDMSGSIRGSSLYAEFVAEDVQVLAVSSDAPQTHFIMWGSNVKEADCMDSLVAHLLDLNFTLGGTEPLCFIERLPTDGVIDLTVVTDGEISSQDIESAAEALRGSHADLRVHRLTLTYVNKCLEHMNMGLSVIFGNIVLGDSIVRVKHGQNSLTSIEVEALDPNIGVLDILDQHISPGKSAEDMMKGLHHLSQRFSVQNMQGKIDMRRIVRDHMERFNREYRNKQLTAEDERQLVKNLDEGRWSAVKDLFVGYKVPEDVKLLQATCQRFLNETKALNVVRISAYAPIAIRDDAGDEEDQNDDEDDAVLLDDITYRALGEDAVMVLPVQLAERDDPGYPNHLEAAFNFDGKVFPDNIISLKTLLDLRESETGQTGALRSSADSFATNPFNRVPMSCVFLVPVNCTALPDTRLREIDCWNEYMLSRYVRGARYVPSLPLSFSIIFQRMFTQWTSSLEALSDDDERGRLAQKVERIISACRSYLASRRTPMTFTVGLPVVLEGTFQTAAFLSCRVLLSGREPAMPIGVLTRFWANLTEERARTAWSALVPFAGLPPSECFPREEYRTLWALTSAMEWKRSGRNAELRERKGLEYSISMYIKYLDHLLAGGCDAARLRHEENFIRRDLFGVPFEAPLLCMHGAQFDTCARRRTDIVLCFETGKPTLLNRRTLDMWYVEVPELRADQATRSAFSFHRALWQLVRKKQDFPKTVDDLLNFIRSRARSFFAGRGGGGEGEGDALLLPTMPCKAMVDGATFVFSTLAELRASRPNLNPKDYLRLLMNPRQVCADGECCAYIREACSKEQLDWINAHATFQQVWDLPDRLRILAGEVSYRG